MQIILTQNEIEDAIRDTVLQQIALKDDQSIAVVFEDDTDCNLIATIDIKKAAPAEVTKPKARAAKKEPVQVAPVQSAAQDEEPAKETLASDLPWKEEEPPKEEAQAPAAAPAPKIFPDPSTSAPAQPEAPAQEAKSLFANLIKSVHDAPQV